MSDEPIVVTVEQGVMTITLNRPDRLNAINPEMRAAWIAALDRSDADDSVRAVIVTGAGRGFCAGADIAKGAEGFVPDTGGGVFRDGGGQLALRIFASKKPIIAAINGPAIGIGISATLPMDFRLASSEAKFGFVYTQRGIAPEGCSSWFLPRLVGISQALDWMLKGRVFGPDEALGAGLVCSVHPPEKLLDAARATAREIADQTAPVSATITRTMLWSLLAAEQPLVAHDIESKVIPLLAGHPDAAEGVAAFFEKRAPQFAGRVSADIPPELLSNMYSQQTTKEGK